MALAIGTRLGVYEITGQLGVGGMGEVYRALDTDLKREVAIKILPPAFANDVDRVARFQREAEALAALNHPNIAQVYGIERGEGRTAIVMELVEGATLAYRIAIGAIAEDEALGIARQVAAALEAAHGRGIVHRDLKPTNIKVRPDGTVKVLDFGIATAPESPTASSGSRSPTLLTPALTEAGILLGTAAYMSPEQARGKAVDERADIWAFGCVLYEMLSGQPAFAGEDVTTTLARVLEREPSSTALPATVSPAVRRTIELCLEKDPRKRIADIRDVRLALEGRFATAAGGPTVPGASAQPAWRRALPLVGALLAGGALAAIVGFALWPKPVSPPVMRFARAIEGIVQIPLVSISRDGSQIGFRAGSPPQIHVRSLDEFDARPIPGTQDAASGALPPCFSPDGTWIAYTTATGGEVKKVPLAGGAALTVATGVSFADMCDWGADGYIYFGMEAGIMRVPEAGGQAELLAAFDAASGESSYESPQLLPGGTHLLFTVLSGGIARLRLDVLDLESRKKTTVLEGAGFATFAPTAPGAAQGHLVYGRAGALFAAPFDLRTLKVGPASPVLEGIAGVGPLASASVSATGTLAYITGGGLSLGTTLRWVDRQGSVQALPEPAHTYGEIVLSPDGRHAAVSIFDLETFRSDLWLYELDGNRLTRLTFGGFNVGAVWTPDGQRLIYWYSESAGAGGELRAVPADNSAPPITLATAQKGPATPTSISGDGKTLIGVVGAGDIWVLPLGDVAAAPSAATGATPQPFLETGFNERDAMLSPDGRFLAYTSNESGRDEVYVVPFPGPGGKTQVSTAGGTLPQWNPSGGELFFANGTQLMAVDVETSPVFRRLTPRTLFETGALANPLSDAYSVAPDGSRFLMTDFGDVNAGQQFDLRVVVNWFEELRRLAPTK